MYIKKQIIDRRQLKWYNFIVYYSFYVQYVKRNTNFITDFMSRVLIIKWKIDQTPNQCKWIKITKNNLSKVYAAFCRF